MYACIECYSKKKSYYYAMPCEWVLTNAVGEVELNVGDLYGGFVAFGNDPNESSLLFAVDAWKKCLFCCGVILLKLKLDKLLGDCPLL